MNFLKFLLIATGRPIFSLMRFLFLRPVYKVKKTSHPIIIYQSSSSHLKRFLKQLYPWVHFIKSIHPPRMPLFRFKVYWRLVQLLLLVSLGLSVYLYIFKDLPSIDSLSTDTPLLTTHIRDRN